MKKLSLLSLFIFSFSFFTHLNGQTGKWTAVKTPAPHENMGVCLLMTDGTVICHTTNGPGEGTGWDRLTPDSTGSYINGKWDTIASMHYDRLFFSTQVLPSGKVYAAGGEYGAGDTAGEVYNPVTNTWAPCFGVPSGWNIYDGNSELLYNGNVLEGPQIGSATSYNIMTWSPVNNEYTAQANSIYDHDEAQWLKLPDSSVLFVGIATNLSNRYIPQTNTWVNDGSLPGNLYDPYGEEAGNAYMLPNGNAVFFGATPFNAIYTPTGNSTPGTWSAADSFPIIQGTYMGQPDATGAMMVNGHILVSVSPIGTSSNEFNSPCYFLEYDYVTNTFAQVFDTLPGIGGDSLPVASFQTQMLDLPDGNVLLSISQAGGLSNQYYVYTPGSAPIPQGKPTIDNIIPGGCPIYRITGKLFNGISEGAAYGDDWQMETNYPIVRLTNGTQVYYATTSNWNRIGAVQTDSLEDTATFALPKNLPAGTYSLVVVANGFASNPVLFTTYGMAITESNIACFGGVGNATAIANGGLSPYTYAWSPGGETTANVTGLSAGVYSVITTDNNGCAFTSSIVITQPSSAVDITLASSSNIACYNGTTGSATANAATGGTPSYTYSWAPTGGNSLTASGLSAGTYTVTVTDNHGCTSTASTTITQPAGMDIKTDSINSSSASGAGCNGEAWVTVLSGGKTPYTYLWSVGGQTTDTINSQCEGNYCCVVTDNNGCSQTVCVDIKSTTGITTIKSGNGQISVYPNPSNGKFIFEIANNESGNTTLEVYNVLGQTVFSQSNHNAQFTINLINQSDGIYFYRVLKQDGSLIGEGKLVKQ